MSVKEINQQILDQWEKIKVLVAASEDDVVKNARGNASAGVRARKGLRAIKTEAHNLVKLTVEESKRSKSKPEVETQAEAATE